MRDRLGKHADCFPRDQEELEERANERVPDDEILYRDPNIGRRGSNEKIYQPVWKT